MGGRASTTLGSQFMNKVEGMMKYTQRKGLDLKVPFSQHGSVQTIFASVDVFRMWSLKKYSISLLSMPRNLMWGLCHAMLLYCYW